ncbi:MAG: hypothetical protein KatS3mg129_2780 [Leptospiraceae bacterium]|nr:MAG: hypothetical protein KatS3mg129_2780 [Leptospiraceae bacterium]
MNYLEFLNKYKKFTLLLLDTSSKWIICSYFKIQNINSTYSIETLYKKEDIAFRNSFQKLSIYIKEIFDSYSKPDLIICGLGPGSFTGVRISVLTARTLSQILHIPVIGIDSLTLYSYSLYKEFNLNHFFIGIDGKQKKYYIKEFSFDNLFSRILDLSKKKILTLINNDILYVDNSNEILSWFNKEEQTKYKNQIKTITNLNSEAMIKIIFTKEFIEHSQMYFYTNYKSIIPIYLRKDPANEKFPEGLAKL